MNRRLSGQHQQWLACQALSVDDVDVFFLGGREDLFCKFLEVALDRKVDAILADGASLESFEGQTHESESKSKL